MCTYNNVIFEKKTGLLIDKLILQILKENKLLTRKISKIQEKGRKHANEKEKVRPIILTTISSKKKTSFKIFLYFFYHFLWRSSISLADLSQFFFNLERKFPFVVHERYLTQTTRVADPDPVFLHGSGSGSGFHISLDPDPVFKFSGSGPGSGFSQDSAERSLKSIYQKKT